MAMKNLVSGLRQSGLIMLAVFLFALTAQATNYYVSNSGSDGNNGTSTSTPWKTLAKVNSITFVAGDTISLQCGGVWREQLRPLGSSGTAGNPIVFQTYGTGAKPLLLGTRPLPNAAFTLYQGTTYQITTTFPVDHHTVISIDHVSTIYDPLSGGGLGGGQGIADVCANVGWCTVNDSAGSTSTIYVNTGGSNPATDGRLYAAVTMPKLEGIIYLSGNSFVTIRNIAVSECMGIEECKGIRVEYGTDITLDGCEASQVGEACFAVLGTANFVGKNLLASSMMPGQTYKAPFAYWVQQGATATFDDCIGTNLLDSATGNSPYPLVGTGDTGGTVTFNNLSCTGPTAGGFSTGGSVLTVNGGVLDNCHVEQFAGNSHFNGVHFRGTSWFDVYSTGNIYENCIMDNVNPPQAGAWFFRDGAGANTIRFCTVKMAGGQPIYFGGSSAGTKWYGNIMVGAGTITDGGNTADLAGTDYNFYQSNPAFNWGGVTFASWKAAGLDTHSLTGDPLFNSGAYTLQASSPCKDAAGGVPAVVSPDAAGTVRPQGSAPDMGAYESGGAPTPPVITSATTASGTTGQPFSYQITASGSPTNFNATGLPSGLTVNRGTGLISGTPTQAGTNVVTLSATGSGGTGTTSLTITVLLPAAPVITSSTVVTGMLSQAFSYQIVATGSPTNYDATGLPSGLSINRSSGLISGTPANAGTNSVALSATGAGGTGTASLTLVVSAVPPSQPVFRINCGGDALDPFAADAFFSGGGSYGTAATIDMTGVTDPAPTGVYQSSRYTTDLGYVFTNNLTSGTVYKVRMHFAELYYTTTGHRLFNISLNGTQVRTNFDIVAAAGAGNKAAVLECTTTADSSGISIWMHSTLDNASINGIEIWTTGSSSGKEPPTITIGPRTNQTGTIQLSWPSESGTTYAVYRTTNLLAGWPSQPVTNISGDGATKVFSEPIGANNYAYYRLKAL
jgi:hypothetical protein